MQEQGSKKEKKEHYVSFKGLEDGAPLELAGTERFCILKVVLLKNENQRGSAGCSVCLRAG